ncbi:MAG: PHP-associated domain-containing protein [Desulfobacterales bacterium]
MNIGVDLHIHPLAERIPDNPLGAHARKIVEDRAKTFVKAASDVGLSAIAVTDHNTTVSVGPAQEAGKEYGVEIVPGVEITLPHMPHLLVYYPDMDEITADLADGTFREKSDSILNGLRKHSGHSETHLWEVEGYDRTITKIIELISSYHGVIVQAHPQLDLRSHNTLIDPEAELDWTRHLTRILINAGIRGVEAYTPRHSRNALSDLVTTLDSRNMIMAGGSDAHSPDEVGRIYFFPDKDIIRIDYNVVEQLRNARESILMGKSWQ